MIHGEKNPCSRIYGGVFRIQPQTEVPQGQRPHHQSGPGAIADPMLRRSWNPEACLTYLRYFKPISSAIQADQPVLHRIQGPKYPPNPKIFQPKGEPQPTFATCRPRRSFRLLPPAPPQFPPPAGELPPACSAPGGSPCAEALGWMLPSQEPLGCGSKNPEYQHGLPW